MGSLGGHLVPGSIFILIGLWWMYSTWLRYFLCRQRRRSYFVSASFPFYCCGSQIARLPIEAFFVLFGTSLGILIELIAGFNRTFDPVTNQSSIYFGANNLQHFGMYSMFFLAGIVQLLLHYNLPLPKDLDIIAGCLAFAAEALLFYFHGHAQNGVEYQIHIFLVLAIISTIPAGIFELVTKEKHVFATLMRAYSTFLQGSWFYTAGFFLYSPFHEHYEQSRDPDVHRTSMLIPYYFVLHIAGSFFLLILFALPAYFASKRLSVEIREYGRVVVEEEEEEAEMEKLNGTADHTLTS